MVQPAGVTPDAPPPIVRPQEVPEAVDNYFRALIQRARLEIFDEVIAAVNDTYYPVKVSVDALATRVETRTGSSLKVPLPNFYDGSRDQGEAFIRSVTIYRDLRAQDFADDGQLTTWILSFMNQGRARTWRDQAIAEKENAEGHAYRWKDMDAFVADFKSEFFPIGEAEEALAMLEGRSYFQKASEGVDAYVDRFRELVKRAELHDQSSVVIKFRRGLSETLVNTLADSPHPPTSTDLDQWVSRARNLERSRSLQRNIAGPKPSLPTHRPGLASAFRMTAPAPQRTVSNPISPTPPPKLTTSGQTPMDVDALRRARLAQVVCHRCKEVGHYSNNCPRSFDIRYMNIEEIEEHRARALDSAELEEKARQQEEEEERPEDFGAASG